VWGGTMDIQKEIRKFIANNFMFTEGDSRLKDETSFLEKGILDSTGILEVVSFIEEKYGIKVEDDEMVPENLDSIRNISRFISLKLDLSVKT
jgi:acyl carrier protein